MKFYTVPIAEAEGAILAHSVVLTDISFKKGRKLSAADLGALSAHGGRDVMVARLEAGDVSEDAAAGRIARALAGTGVTTGEPFTGRANLYAASAGLATINRDIVIALNSIDEGLTLATIPPYERVAARQMLATIKVIPFALPEAVVAAAEALHARPAPRSASRRSGRRRRA